MVPGVWGNGLGLAQGHRQVGKAQTRDPNQGLEEWGAGLGIAAASSSSSQVGAPSSYLPPSLPGPPFLPHPSCCLFFWKTLQQNSLEACLSQVSSVFPLASQALSPPPPLRVRSCHARHGLPVAESDQGSSAIVPNPTSCRPPPLGFWTPRCCSPLTSGLIPLVSSEGPSTPHPLQAGVPQGTDLVHFLFGTQVSYFEDPGHVYYFKYHLFTVLYLTSLWLETPHLECRFLSHHPLSISTRPSSEHLKLHLQTQLDLALRPPPTNTRTSNLPLSALAP